MMNKDDLQKILENHKHWANEDCDGWEDMRADLHWADLRGADLCRADLRWVDLRRADLRGADLREADLRWADLCGADLRGADLCGADLRGADLRWADLRGADLCRADLRWADLRRADLRGADLRGVKNIPFIPLACPEKGAFTAFKKARSLIVELEIPADARRSSAATRKCRCDKAKVISITDEEGEPFEVGEIASNYDEEFKYKVGEIVEEPNFCEDRWQECAEGIHFFINRQEAVDY